MLESFCQKVAEYPWLYGSEEFQLFLRGTGDFRTELHRAAQPNLYSLRMLYTQAFPTGPDHDPGPELSTFSSLLASVLGYVKYSKVESRAVAAHATALNKEGVKLAESLAALEQNCLSVLSPGMKTGFFPADINQEAENPFLALFYWLIKEENELQTMIECMDSRFSLLSAINSTRNKLEKSQHELAGLRGGEKLSLGSILQFKSKAKRMLELEAGIRDMTMNLDNMTDLLLRVDGWLTSVEIPRFKSIRAKEYLAALRLYSTVLLKEYGALAQMYAAMAEK